MIFAKFKKGGKRNVSHFWHLLIKFGGLKMRKKNITLVLTAVFLVVILATTATAFNPIYKIMSFFNIGIAPMIIAGNVYPVKVQPGDVLLLNISAKDVYGIESVKAKVYHESDYDLVNLALIDGTEKDGLYQGTWICHNAKNMEWYDVKIEVTNIKGMSSFMTLQYLDPTQNHPASEVTAGTFDAGDFIFQATVTADAFVGNGSQLTEIVPSGVIVMWSGTIANIPSGWVLCNGSSGTPDLRDRFIYGVSAGENPGATGGSTQHNHSYYEYILGSTAGNSYAGVPEGNSDPGVGRVQGLSAANGAGAVSTYRWTRDTEFGSSLPTYYKLAFIMKL